MSEEKKPRTLADVQSDFSNLAVKAGQVQYQIHVLQQDLDLLNNQMRDLNFEAAKVQSEEKKETPNA